MYFLRTCLSNNPQAIIPLRTINSILFCILTLAAASCSEVENLILGEDDREPISFSMSDEGVRATRAGFCGGQTFIAMRMQSSSKKGGATLYTKTTATAEVDNTNSDESYSSVTFTDDERCYWDDAHGQYSKLSVFAVAIPNMAKDVMELNGLLADGGSSTLTGKWGTNDTNTIKWTVSTTQTKDDIAAPVTGASGTIDKEDLVYSNNIREGGEDGVYRWSFKNSQYEPNLTGELGVHEDGPMMFLTPDDKDNPLNTPSSMQGKFDKGHLVFKHALSRITVTLNKGEGFLGDDTFNFTDDQGEADQSTIKLHNMNTSGTLYLPTGNWSGVGQTDIEKMGRKGTGSTAEGTFVGQMLPGYVFADNVNTTVMTFTIDGNTYYVTQDMLYDALAAKTANPDYGYTADKFTMMQGKNYQFILTVNKRKVEAITASLVPWEDVTAVEKNLTNARIKLQLEERGTKQTSDVAFYKAEDNNTGDFNDNYTTWKWKTGYADLNATYKNGKWTTESFWKTSRDFYHFRALMPAATVVTKDGSGDGDYATLTSAASYTDVCWGAPMLDDKADEIAGDFKWLYGPETNGFDADDSGNIADGLTADPKHQIYKAIGATEDPVKLTLFHVMSDLTFKIKTTTDADKVKLYDAGTHTRLDLVGFYNGGKVLLGTGLVKTTGTASTEALPVNIGAPTSGDTDAYTDKTYHFGAVPQDLTAVKLYITTPDGNQYIIDLKDVKATAVSSVNLANPYEQGSDGKYTLSRWYPGFKYNYTFTLKKTGITNLQATVVDWETVTAADETVTIK